MASLIASSSTAERPTRWSITRLGTLPLRKPGTEICAAMRLYAASSAGFSSSNGTSTVSFTRLGERVSTALFTGIGAPGWSTSAAVATQGSYGVPAGHGDGRGPSPPG